MALEEPGMGVRERGRLEETDRGVPLCTAGTSSSTSSSSAEEPLGPSSAWEVLSMVKLN
jgi:hypothetical protein